MVEEMQSVSKRDIPTEASIKRLVLMTSARVLFRFTTEALTI